MLWYFGSASNLQNNYQLKLSNKCSEVKYNVWFQNVMERKYKVTERGNIQVKYKPLKIVLKYNVWVNKPSYISSVDNIWLLLRYTYAKLTLLHGYLCFIYLFVYNGKKS